MVLMFKLSGPCAWNGRSVRYEVARQVLSGTDFWALLMGLTGTSSLVVLSSWTPVPALDFKGSEGLVDRHQGYKSVASGKSK